ncbi:DUF4085 family protein [Paenibacillus xylaniclasticus]|uniref:DUF4085 family protein n=1 Tax=Paenibacillus xylaniclasticus TaxID=588083 RepID=UPI000FD6F36B|nr:MULTISPECIES: DUF4085 family protein [Paenibacillus]GFN33015.1 hypothetical protein PCURB6_32750 [Paenibacillus curdlanolyticus]
MKYFTKDWFEELQLSCLLQFPETKEEWEEEVSLYEAEGFNFEEMSRLTLERDKSKFLKYLPDAFHPYILDGTLTTQYPSEQLKLMAKQWVEKTRKQSRALGEKYHGHYMAIRESLPDNVVQLCKKTLHDARVLSTERRSQDTFSITLDCKGAFHYHTNVIITFTGVSHIQPADLKPNSSWLYDEVYLTNTGFELHVLFECPLMEFIIAADNVTIEVLPQNT